MWTIGLALLAGRSEKGAWKKMLNAPLFAVILGSLFAVFRWDRFVPGPVASGMDMLGVTSVPMALLLIGATIYDYFTPRFSASSLRVISMACLVRLGLVPLLFIALVQWLPCSLELKRVLVLQAGMPTAVFPIVVTRHYGGDIPTALRAVLGTSLVSLVTMPLWIGWGLSLLP